MNQFQQQFCNIHNLTEAQFFGKEPIEGYLDLSSLISIPVGFNPTVGGYLDLSSLISIPVGFNPTVGGYLNLCSLTSIPVGFNPTVGWWFDLSSLTSIPEGFNPTVGGSLYLNSLTSIPVGFNPTVGGYLDLRSLTNIPVGFNPTVGGSLNLRNLTSIPEGFNPIVGDKIWFNSIHSGFNKSKLEHQSIPLIQWNTPRGRFIKCDGRFSQLVSHRGNLWVLKNIGRTQEYYLVTDGNGNFAHGDTLGEAKRDLLFKTSKRDKSEYVGLYLDEKHSFEDCVIMYRTITGACSNGIKNFLSSIEIEEKPYSISEIIQLTQNQYGGNEFKEFFIAA